MEKLIIKMFIVSYAYIASVSTVLKVSNRPSRCLRGGPVTRADHSLRTAVLEPDGYFLPRAVKKGDGEIILMIMIMMIIKK